MGMRILGELNQSNEICEPPRLTLLLNRRLHTRGDGVPLKNPQACEVDPKNWFHSCNTTNFLTLLVKTEVAADAQADHIQYVNPDSVIYWEVHASSLPLNHRCTRC